MGNFIGILIGGLLGFFFSTTGLIILLSAVLIAVAVLDWKFGQGKLVFAALGLGGVLFICFVIRPLLEKLMLFIAGNHQN